MKGAVCSRNGEIVKAHVVNLLSNHTDHHKIVTQKEKPNSLFYMSIAYHGRSFASGILPRLCATGFNFCQPFLIKRVIDYLSNAGSHGDSNQIGRALIGAYCIVYVGFSVSDSLGSTPALALLNLRQDFRNMAPTQNLSQCHQASSKFGQHNI